MTTASRLPQRRLPGRASLATTTAARAVVAAVLAAVVTFSTNHDIPAFDLGVLGVFAIMFGLVTLAGVRPMRAGRALVVARAAVLVVGGATALALMGAGLAALVPLEALIFLLAGVLEVVSGLRRTGVPEVAGDAIVVGGLQVLVGVLLVVLDRNAILAVGVLGAWGAVVAVYLGIAAVSLRRQGVRP